MLRVFYGNKKLNFKKHEIEQFMELLKLLRDEFEESNEHIFLFVDYRIGGKQFDVFLIKEDAIIIIEMKSYSGKILGNENGEWTVVTADGEVTIETENENPYTQVSNQRWVLIDKLKQILPDINSRFSHTIKNISAWLYFKEGSYYIFGHGQIDNDRDRWFDVVTPSNVIEKINNENSSGEFSFYPEEMEELVKPGRLNGYEKTDELLKLVKPENISKQKQLAKSEDIKKIEKVIKELKKSSVQPLDIKKMENAINDLKKSSVQQEDIKKIEKKIDELNRAKAFDNADIKKGLDDHKKSIEALGKKISIAEKHKFPTKSIITLIIVLIIVFSALFLCQKLEQIFNNTVNNFRNMVNDSRNWATSNISSVTMNPSYTAYPPHTTIWTVNTTKGVPAYISDLAWALLDSSTNTNATGASINILDNNGDTYLTPGDTISVTAPTDGHYIFLLFDKKAGIIFRSE